MKVQTISRFVAAFLAALTLGACADPSTSPDGRALAERPSTVVNADQPTDPPPEDQGDVEVCKNIGAGPAQSFTFNVTVNGGAPVQHVIAGGNCAVVYTSLVFNTPAPDVVTVSEVAVANWSITDIVLDRFVPPPPFVVNPDALLTEDNVTATVGINSDIKVRVTFVNAFTPPAGALFIILDEDAIDNDLRFDPTPSGPYSPHSALVGQDITSNTQTKFTKANVNDDIASKTQRSPLRYFSGPPNGPAFGTNITILSGSTGDEGWFAPTVAPTKWCTTAQINGGTCTPQQAIANLLGFGSGIPAQDKLDKIPEVVPLRALGLHLLEGQLLCALVYDSDIGINYDAGKTPFLTANLQGETLGIAAFTVVVHGVNRLQGFSSSTLPEVRLRIENPSVCSGPLSLFAAPVPNTSSIPNDINPHNTPGVGPNGYKSIP